MGYLVLARKWRPQGFGQVIGQDHVTQALQNAIRYGRVAHAFLFTGARGVGKTSVARILAKALNCDTGPTVTPCDKCSTCREITGGSAVDVYEIDGASNRGIDEIRELRENIKYLPAKCRYKIYIIDEVHMLTTEAFNALLKTLEEPPAHVIFVFATTEPHRIPITILSRCQRYDFKRLSLQEITDQLEAITRQEGITLSRRSLRFIAREAEGGMRDALSLLDRIISYSGEEVTDDKIASIVGFADQRAVIALAAALMEHDLASGLQSIDHVYTYGHDLKRFYADLVEVVRNLIVIKICRQADQLADLTEDERGELDKLGQGKSVETLYLYFQLLMEGWDELRRSPHPKLTFEMVLMKAALLKDIVPIQQILERISLLSPSGGDLRRAAPCPETSPGEMPVESPSGLIAPHAAGPVQVSGDFVSFVRSRSLPLASILQQSAELTMTDGTLSVRFADSSLPDLLKNPPYEERLRDLCREYYRQDVRINILGDSPPALAHTAAEQMERYSVKEELLKHPLVQETLDIFDAHIEDIEVENA